MALSALIQSKIWKNQQSCLGVFIFLTIVLLATAGKLLMPFDPANTELALRLSPPSSAHLFGCDLYGRDLLSAVCEGAYITLYIALSSVTLTLLLGTILGLISGYFGGLKDRVIMGVAEVIMAFPGILLIMAITAFLGPSSENIIITLSLTGWTAPARMVRAEAMRIKELDYIAATQALGGKWYYTIFRHILPNQLPMLTVLGTFSMASVVLTEASLSFLGLGVIEETPTWGSLLNQGRTVLTDAPHISLFPGLLIFLTVLSLNFLGESLQDFLDPKSKITR